MQTTTLAVHVTALIFLALSVNVPLGYKRQGCRKFSRGWFVYVHASIPLIIAARFMLRLGLPYIPFSLASAVLGQLVGGRMYRKRNALG